MILYRITYTDRKGLVENQWFGNNAAAVCAAAWLSGTDHVDVVVEPMTLPDGDAAWLRWLNENPNTPQIKDGTMHPSTCTAAEPAEFTGRVNQFPEPASTLTLKLHPAAIERANFDKPLEWQDVPNPTAESLLDHVLEQRGNRYGKFTGHAKITQALKSVMQGTDNWAKLDDDQKEALEMTAHKIGRILNGDPNYDDSWVDIAGYIQLVSKRLQGTEV